MALPVPGRLRVDSGTQPTGTDPLRSAYETERPSGIPGTRYLGGLPAPVPGPTRADTSYDEHLRDRRIHPAHDQSVRHGTLAVLY